MCVSYLTLLLHSTSMIPEGKERDCKEEKCQSYFLVRSGSANTPSLGVLLNVELPEQTAGFAPQAQSPSHRHGAQSPPGSLSNIE